MQGFFAFSFISHLAFTIDLYLEYQKAQQYALSIIPTIRVAAKEGVAAEKDAQETVLTAKEIPQESDKSSREFAIGDYPENK